MLLFVLLWVSSLSRVGGLDTQAGTPTTPVRAVHLPESRLSLPSVQNRVLPRYPAGPSPVRGFVDLEIVIDAGGNVAHARVSKPLADSVDNDALLAGGKWRFRPASDRNGRAVTMLMILRMTYDPPDQAGGAGNVSGDLLQPPKFTPPSVDQFASAVAVSPKPAGLQLPKVVRNIMPSYTPDAMRAKIQGIVEMQVVVAADGTVGAIRVVKSLDDKYGLDEQAIQAAARWFFEPGTLNGSAVATVVTLVLEFRLH